MRLSVNVQVPHVRILLLGKIPQLANGLLQRVTVGYESAEGGRQRVGFQHEYAATVDGSGLDGLFGDVQKLAHNRLGSITLLVIVQIVVLFDALHGFLANDVKQQKHLLDVRLGALAGGMERRRSVRKQESGKRRVRLFDRGHFLGQFCTLDGSDGDINVRRLALGINFEAQRHGFGILDQGDEGIHPAFTEFSADLGSFVVTDVFDAFVEAFAELLNGHLAKALRQIAHVHAHCKRVVLIQAAEQLGWISGQILQHFLLVANESPAFLLLDEHRLRSVRPDLQDAVTSIFRFANLLFQRGQEDIQVLHRDEAHGRRLVLVRQYHIGSDGLLSVQWGCVRRCHEGRQPAKVASPSRFGDVANISQQFVRSGNGYHSDRLDFLCRLLRGSLSQGQRHQHDSHKGG